MEDSKKTSELSGSMKIVLIGCLILMLSIASHGLALSTIQGPVLDMLGGAQWFSLITVLASIAVCVMTPIGGRLAGMLGPGRLILISGAGAIVFGLLMAFVSNLWVFMICRVLLSICMGAYASVPYIIVNTQLPPDLAPKWVGYLATVAAIGGVGGSYLSGFLAGKGMYGIAMAFPLIFVAIAMWMIGTHMKDNRPVKLSLDWLGILLLTGTLGGLLLGLNNGPIDGWFSRSVMFSFFIGFVCLLAFIWWENKAKNPLMPMGIFKIKSFSMVILIGFMMGFYLNPMNVYIPLAAQNIMNASTALSGALQVPKSILMLILPSIAGAWVVKKASNIWKSMFIAGLSLTLCFGLLVFIGPKMPIWFLMACIALTAVSESYRSVGLLPAVQRVLPRSDLAVGTSLIGFIMTLSGSVSSAFCGLAYNSLTSKTAGLRGMIDGIDTICLLIAFVSFVGAMLVILFLRPMLAEKMKQLQEQKAAKA